MKDIIHLTDMNLLDLLFPKKCVGCGALGNYFCLDCIQQIKQNDLVCPHCERMGLGGATHPICKRRYNLDGLWSLGVYQDPLRKAVQKLKYKFVTELAGDLIDITIEYWARYSPFLLTQIKKNWGRDWVIVPVPLHKKRENWRGFNQAELLSKIFATKLGLEYSNCLIRVKNTKQQAKLASNMRHQNIKDAFALSKNQELITKNIILVDDVWTTGSTLKECCFALKKNGAKKVWALTLAR